jgi:hypothetical protein
MLAHEQHLLPSPGPQESPAGGIPSFESIAGDLIASIGTLIGRGLIEIRQTGQTSVDTKRWGAAALSLLCELHVAGALDFDQAAIYGRCELRKRSGDTISDATVDRLIDAALEVLGKTIKLRMH